MTANSCFTTPEAVFLQLEINVVGEAQSSRICWERPWWIWTMTALLTLSEPASVRYTRTNLEPGPTIGSLKKYNCSREREPQGTYAHRIFQKTPMPPAVPRASCQGESWTEIWHRRHDPIQAGCKKSVDYWITTVSISAPNSMSPLTAPRLLCIKNTKTSLPRTQRSSWAHAFDALDVRTPSTLVQRWARPR